MFEINGTGTGLASKKRDMRGIAVRVLPFVALILMLLAIFLPWWTVSTSRLGYTYDIHDDFEGDYGPGWTPFELSSLGVGLNIHFWNILIFMSISIALLVPSILLTRQSPRVSLFLQWGATFSILVGLLFFTLSFPRIGYVDNTGNHIFWITGSADCYCPSIANRMSWHASTGFFLTFVSVNVLMVHSVYISVRRPMKKDDIQQEGKSSPAKKWYDKTVTRVLVFPVVWIVIISVIWIGLTQPPTISVEAFVNEFDYFPPSKWKSYEEGDMVYVTGIVTEVTILPTSYGPLSMIRLDEDTAHFFMEGDLRSHYPIGGRVTIPVHFRTYYYNGFEYPWVDETINQPVIISSSMMTLAYSFAYGLALIPDSTGPTSVRYRVYTGQGLPIDAFNVSLLESGHPDFDMSVWWIYADRLGLDLVDQMETLRVGWSDGGTFEFTDVNNNGLLDWNDTFEVILSPTQDFYHIEAYVLRILGPNDGGAYIPVRERGPLIIMTQQMDNMPPFYWFEMSPDRVSGNACSSNINVSRTFYNEERASNLTLEITRSDSPLKAILPADLSQLSLPWDGTISRYDGGRAGILDIGDSYTLENITTGAEYQFSVKPNPSEGSIGSITWTCGLGPRIANRPKVTLSQPFPDPGNAERLVINITAVDWTPGMRLQSFSTLLLKNSTVLLPLDGRKIGLGSLPVGPSIDGAGTWLHFNDTDRNGYLSVGDAFEVNRTASQSTYELFLYYDRILTSVGWTT